MSKAKPYINVDLDYETLSTIHGWANFVKFSASAEEQTWDAEDERVRGAVFDMLHPFLAPCLRDKLVSRP